MSKVSIKTSGEKRYLSSDVEENNSTEIPKLPKDPRCDDFGQFRIEGVFADAEHLIEALVNNGYSVTLREDRSKSSYGTACRVIVMYKFNADL